MGKKRKTKRNIIQKITFFLIVITCISSVIWACLYMANRAMGDEEVLNADGTKAESNVRKKQVINALVCGVNETLTDTMIYVKYYVETGKIYMMSVPRDTYVVNDYCYGHKLNSIYRGEMVVPLVEEIQELFIQDGKDMITLITCHPYGINNQRYLVFAERKI